MKVKFSTDLLIVMLLAKLEELQATLKQRMVTKKLLAVL
jgi:hypothetical protein